MDYIEIIVLTWLVYILIRFVRETRAIQTIRGILFIFIILLLLQQFRFKVLGVLSETIISVGAMAVIVMFQPELRRVLEKMGRARLVKSIATNFESEPYKTSSWIDQIASSCEKLSHKAIGALIVIEKDTKLGEQINTGTILNAVPSEELFGNLFHPHTPLHDGAVIVRDGMILAAGCFLPKPQQEEFISKDLGSRHRAAIGMSEVSDAVIIIVSEETGTISIAKGGTLERGFDYQKLHDYLTDALIPSPKKKPKYKTPVSEETDEDYHIENENKGGEGLTDENL
ncbi:MAG: diadenylate cyclase CdaA [Oscillospiraceae bacterium]|nr:diadenylate cyclase CdaA [Oscillospiraceae bacterium]